MKSKIVNYLIGIAIIALVLYVVSTSRKDEYKAIPLSTHNHIVNETDKKYLDTVVSATLDQLQLKGIHVTIKPLSEVVINSFDKGFNLRATIRGNSSHYTIYVNPDLKQNESTRVIAHELVHLVQYETKELEIKGGGVVYWRGKQVDLAHLSYEERMWERIAFDQEGELNAQVRDKILK